MICSDFLAFKNKKVLLINSTCGNRRKAPHGFVNILEMKDEEGQRRKGQYQMEKLLAALQRQAMQRAINSSKC